MCDDYKITTGPFLFCLNKAAVLNDFSRSDFILDRTRSIQLIVLFLSPTRTKSTTSNEESIETAEKTTKATSCTANEGKIGNKMSLITVCKGESSID